MNDYDHFENTAYNSNLSDTVIIDTVVSHFSEHPPPLHDIMISINRPQPVGYTVNSTNGDRLQDRRLY